MEDAPVIDVAVIGGGIFGRVITGFLRREGATVSMVDDARPHSGSAAAGCVIKPSWISALSRADLDAGLLLLDDLYGVHDVRFRLWPAPTHADAFRVDPASILESWSGPGDWRGRATAIDDNPGDAAVVSGITRDRPFLIEARHVVVAAGVWTGELCPWVKVDGRWGWSFRGPPAAEPVIRAWAPYKQVVALNLSDGRSWSGDGSALIESSATSARLEAARTRCMSALGVSEPTALVSTLGVRPYTNLRNGGAPCHVSRRERVIAVTGGAKNGTIAAAWAARRVLEEIGR